MTEQHPSQLSEFEVDIHALADTLTMPLVSAVRETIVTHGIKIGAPALCIALGRAAGLSICAVHEEHPRGLLRGMLNQSMDLSIEKFDRYAVEKKEANHA